MKYHMYTLLQLLFIIQIGETLICQQQVCRECSEDKSSGPSREIICDTSNVVGLDLLGTTDTSNFPKPLNVGIDYACIKMVASNPNVNGDSTDVIRGCTFYLIADQMCTVLTSVESARKKSNARCRWCTGDNCNFSIINKPSSSFLVISVFICIILSNIWKCK